MNSKTVDLKCGRLSRISLLDLPVPPELLGLTVQQLSGVSWAQPTWVSDDQVNLGAAAWVFETADQRLVYDPMMALDLVLRPDPATQRKNELRVTEAFAAAGFPIESIDQVLVSHVEDIGMLARWTDEHGWQPFFANATIRLSAAELTAFQAGLEDNDSASDQPVLAAWSSLIEQGCIEPIEDSGQLAAGVYAEVSGGHSAGHTVFHLGQATAPEVTLIGHLAVSPVHMATGECADLNNDAAAAWRLLHDNAQDARLLIGSLWPTPGIGRWVDDRLAGEDHGPVG